MTWDGAPANIANWLQSEVDWNRTPRTNGIVSRTPSQTLNAAITDLSQIARLSDGGRSMRDLQRTDERRVCRLLRQGTSQLSATRSRDAIGFCQKTLGRHQARGISLH